MLQQLGKGLRQRKQQRQVIEEGVPEDIPLTQPRWTFNTRMHQKEEV